MIPFLVLIVLGTVGTAAGFLGLMDEGAEAVWWRRLFWQALLTLCGVCSVVGTLGVLVLVLKEVVS